MILNREPALFAGAVAALLNVLILLNVLSWSSDQVAAVNAFVAALLALLVRSRVTPTLGGQRQSPRD